LDASLASHATLGVLADHLWQRTQASRREIDEITSFCTASR
jgi:hypothetical protein